MAFGEHTSKSIIGTKSIKLKNKKIILCITGSVAAIKSPDIARELMRHGADVYVVMTEMAKKIIHPDMLEWSTGNPVVDELTGQVEHVQYGGEHSKHADLILVAPSTANTIGKIASAIDDTPVTTLLTTSIGAGIPIIIAPAMHASMYKHPFVIDNIKKLQSIGLQVLMPRLEENKAKMPDVSEIINAVIEKFTKPNDLIGKKILITAGPTHSYIDAFRYITNPSSGKMGIAVAEEASQRGAEVTLILGPSKVQTPLNINVMRIETTKEMMSAVTSEIKTKKYNIAIFTAAVSDWEPEKRTIEKTPSSKEKWILNLKASPKIISQVKSIDSQIFLVGFKAEYNIEKEELVNRSYKRLKEMNMDLIVANDVSDEQSGFSVDTNEVYIIDKNKQILHIPLTSKKEIAIKLLDIISNSV